MIKILGIVFFFNPDLDKAIPNIERYIDYLDKLIVWNNSPNSAFDAYTQAFEHKPYSNKLIFDGGRGNVGMSKPINNAIKKTIDDGYDCLLTMDQDSVWQDFACYIEEIGKRDFLHNAFYPSINFCRGDMDVQNIEFDFLINSGMVYGREALREVGLMNEHFFVEGIDTEYGFRIMVNKKVKLFRVNKALLKQNIGESDKINMVVLPSWVKWLCNRFNKNIVRCKYDSARLYGIGFSKMVISREFPGYIGNTVKRQLSVKWFVKYCLVPILLYSHPESKLKRITAYLSGLHRGGGGGCLCLRHI